LRISIAIIFSHAHIRNEIHAERNRVWNNSRFFEPRKTDLINESKLNLRATPTAFVFLLVRFGDFDHL
jgi:hypothetical protein